MSGGSLPQRIRNRFWQLPDGLADLRRTHREWVYFLLAPDLLRIKIGRTYQLKWRLVAIQSYAPIELKLCACVTAPRGAERIFHKILKHSRLLGEWFEYGPEVRALIRALPKGEPISGPELQALVNLHAQQKFDIEPLLNHSSGRVDSSRVLRTRLAQLDREYWRRAMKFEDYDAMRASLLGI